MKRSIRLLYAGAMAIFITTFMSGQARAEQPGGVVIFVGDHSDSMLSTIYSSSADIFLVMHALSFVVENYQADCNPLQVDYVAWGSTVAPSIPVNMNDGEERAAFVTKLQTELSVLDLDGTEHYQALYHAIELAKKIGAKRTAIVIVTNGASDLVNLSPPENVVFYKVALGGDDSIVGHYVMTKLAPGHGSTVYATDSAALQDVLNEAILAVKEGACFS